jgi:hypothetical protein
VKFEALPVAAKGVGKNDFCAGRNEAPVQVHDIPGSITIPKFRRLARTKPSQEIIGAGGAIAQHYGPVRKECGQ